MFDLRKMLIVILSIVIWGCGDDESVKTTVLTGSGKEISLDGVWTSDCIDFSSFRLKESFDFNGESLIISIHQFSGETCDNPDATETVTITFQTLETIEAEWKGTTVLANKIRGMQTSSSDNRSSAFKQTFYVDDADGQSALYHGIFADDGGAVSSDGYPLELHPFAIVKE